MPGLSLSDFKLVVSGHHGFISSTGIPGLDFETVIARERLNR